MFGNFSQPRNWIFAYFFAYVFQIDHRFFDENSCFERQSRIAYGCLFKGDELAKAYRINAIPTLVIINKGRTIAKAKVGASGNPEKDLREAITKALAK